MANPIKFSDFFDFSDNAVVQAAIADIKALHAAYGDFKKTVVEGSFANLTAQQNDLTNSIRELIKATEGLNVTNKAAQQTLIDSAKQMAAYDQAIKNLQATKAAMQNTEKAAADSVNGLTAKLKEQVDAYNKLDSASASEKKQMDSLADSIRQTRMELKTLTDQTQIAAEKTKAQADSLNGLQTKLAELKNVFANLSPTLDAKGFKSYADEIRKTEAEIKKLQEATKEIPPVPRVAADSVTALKKKLEELRATYVTLSPVWDKTKMSALADEIRKVEAEIKKLNDATKAIKPVAPPPLAPAGDSVAGLTAKLKGLKDAFDKLSPSTDSGLMQGFTTAIRQTEAALARLKNSLKIEPLKIVAQVPAVDSITGLRDKLAILERQYENLSQSSRGYDAASKQLIADIVTTKNEINTLSQATRVNISTYNAAKGSYAALDQETKKLVSDLKNLEGAFTFNSAKAKQMQQTILDNTNKLKEFDKQMGVSTRNVGNYGSAFDNVGNSLKSYALGLISITALTAGIKNAFEKSLEFSSISRGLSVVSHSVEETDRNMAFLRSTALDLGLQFTDLTGNFNKFYAAATIAGYSAERTRQIFLQFGNAFANIQLSQDKTNSAFLALEQIISKGKVSAEELRRQLGNVLPGAFEIAAKSIGVTTSQLDKMLKSGELVSAEFLPKFAAEVEKTFGDSSGHIDSLQASVNRFKNSIAESFQGSGLQRFFKDVVDSANGVVTFMRSSFSPAFQNSVAELQNMEKQLEKTENALSPLISRFDELKNKAQLSTEEQSELNRIMGQIQNIVPGAATAIDQYGNALDINREKVIEFTKSQRDLADAMRKTAVYDIQQKIKEELAEGEAARKNINARTVPATQGGNPNLASSGKLVRIPIYDTEGRLTSAGKREVETLNKSVDAVNKLSQQLVEAGGELDARTSQFIGGLNADRAKSLKEVQDITQQIREKEIQAYTLMKVGNDKVRQQIIKDIADLKKQRQEILNPGSTAPGLPPKQPDPNDEKKAEALRKKLEREQRERIKKADELNKAAAASEIANAELVYARSLKTFDDEKALDDERLAITNKYAKIRLALYTKGSKDYIDIQTELTDADKKHTEARSKADEEAWKKQTKDLDDYYKRSLGLIKQQEEIRKSEADRVANEATNRIKVDQAKGKITPGKAEDLFHDIRRNELQAEIDNQKAIIEARESTDEAVLTARKNLSEKLKALDDENTQHEISKAEEAAKRKQELQQATFEFVQTLVSGYIELSGQDFETELARIQERRDKDIEAASATTIRKIELGDEERELKEQQERAKADIEKRFTRESNKIKREQAELEKEGTVFSIGLTTAQKVMEAYPNPYLMAAAAALGALQIGIVAAKKIPAYYKGRGDGPGEFAEVNERGFELLKKGDKYRVAGGGAPTVTYLQPGEKVLTHEQSITQITNDYIHSADSDEFLNSLLEGIGVTRRYEDAKQEKFISALAQNQLSPEALLSAFRGAVEAIPIEQHRFDEAGYRRYTKGQNTIVEKLHARQKMGGNG